jgi:hypothetical protein
MLSRELADSLEQLRLAPVKYSQRDKAFSLHINGQTVKKRGLTRVLHEVFPVPFSYDNNYNGEQQRRPTKRARRSPNDPVPTRTVWHRPKCRTASADTCKQATLACQLDDVEPDFGAAGFGPHFNRRHGMTVDQQLKDLVFHGYAGVCGLDPCVATLRDYLHSIGLCIVASQVPIYSPALDIATAFDLGCTDRATRTQFHLCEVKATTGSAADDEHYTRVRGRLKSSVARGTPLSFYVEHQLQLGVQECMIRETLSRPPDSSRVLRVSPNCVVDYKLSPWFSERAEKLLPALQRRSARRQQRGTTNKQKR